MSELAGIFSFDEVWRRWVEKRVEEDEGRLAELTELSDWREKMSEKVEVGVDEKKVEEFGGVTIERAGLGAEVREVKERLRVVEEGIQGLKERLEVVEDVLRVQRGIFGRIYVGKGQGLGAEVREVKERLQRLAEVVINILKREEERKKVERVEEDEGRLAELTELVNWREEVAAEDG